MRVRVHILKMALMATVATTSSLPVSADTKAGVDAWSRGEYPSAIKEWRPAAIDGDADAQFNLGQAYKLGRGVKTDLDVALGWYRKAAAQGHLQAADSCGHVLHYQQKIAEALPFLIASSDRGEPRAQYLLATELFNGVYIAKDWVRAYALMTRAASSGMASAARSLTQMDQYIPTSQREEGTLLAQQMGQKPNPQQTGQMAEAAVAFPPVASTPPVADQKTTTSTAVTTASAVANVSNPAAGNWRVQLGAFGKPDNAQKLWQRLSKTIAEFNQMEPILKKAGMLTLVQAGPFNTKAEADIVCAKLKASGQQCLAISA